MLRTRLKKFFNKTRTKNTIIKAILIAPIIIGTIYLIYVYKSQPSTYTLSTGSPDGIFHKFGQTALPIFNEYFENKINFINKASQGSIHNLNAVNEGNVQLGIAQDGLQVKPNVRALAQLFSSPLHLVARVDKNINNINDLIGKKVFFGSNGSGTRVISNLVVNHLGLDINSNFISKGENWGFENAKDALLNDSISAAFFLVAYGSNAIAELAKDGRFTLLEIDNAEGIAAYTPALEKTVIPTGAYVSSFKMSFPNKDIHTVATKEILICNKDLSDQIAYKLVKALFTSSNKLIGNFTLITQLSRIDPEKNFFYPLHPGAVEFYTRASTPFIVSPSFIIAGFGYAISIFTYLLIWIKRNRIKQIIIALDNCKESVLKLKKSEDESLIYEHKQNIIGLRAKALELYKLDKIKSDQYNIIKEYTTICLDIIEHRTSIK
jgi:uncharacterized protein